MEEKLKISKGWRRVKEDQPTWVSYKGKWRSHPHGELHSTDLNRDTGLFFHPLGIIRMSPMRKNEWMFFELYLTKEGRWVGPFSTFSNAQEAFNGSN